jgi:hypothetical protein
MPAARQGGPFLCSPHASEEVPIASEEAVAGDEPGQLGERPSPTPGGA